MFPCAQRCPLRNPSGRKSCNAGASTAGGRWNIVCVERWDESAHLPRRRRPVLSVPRNNDHLKRSAMRRAPLRALHNLLVRLHGAGVLGGSDRVRVGANAEREVQHLILGLLHFLLHAVHRVGRGLHHAGPGLLEFLGRDPAQGEDVEQCAHGAPP